MKDKVTQYSEQIKSLIERRTGKACEEWLALQVEATAKNMCVLNKLFEELMAAPLLQETTGSREQTKMEASPLLAYYDKTQRTLLLQYESLGLNFKTTPSKVRDKVVEEPPQQDRLMELLQMGKGLNNPENFMEP